MTGLIKRALDVTGALAGTIILSPLMLVAAVAIKVDSRGPVLYKGIRTGLRGIPFTMFKFRTMCVDAERRGGSCTADEDPRITKIGRILRNTKLDELPQLFNVLNGTMSFVGPRPEVKMFTDMFNEEERAILSVRPGITDWASLWDSDEGARLAGSTDPERTYLEQIRPTKLRLQLEYVRRHSLAVDCSIIWKTGVLVLSKMFRRKPSNVQLPIPPRVSANVEQRSTVATERPPLNSRNAGSRSLP